MLANVSTDDGATFNGDMMVGNYNPGVDDVDAFDMGIATNGNVICSWEDNRNGSDDIFAAISTDGGQSWAADTQLSTTGGGFPTVDVARGQLRPLTCPSKPVGNSVSVSWSSGVFPNTANGNVSLDGGATWKGDVTCSGNTGDVDFTEVAYNGVYDNFVFAWAADDLGQNNVYVGGFRPQTIDGNGFVAGATNISFDLSCFNGNATAAAALMATATSPAQLPFDCRFIGISTPSMAFPVVLAGGSGSSAPFATTLPGTGTMVFEAFSLFSEAPIGQITDVGSASW